MTSLTSNSFNIYHDDAVDVIIEIEDIFDIKISNDEAEKTSTFGELLDLLVLKLNVKPCGRKCASQMAFYKIKSAVKDKISGATLSPSTELHALTDDPYDLYHHIRRHAEINFITASTQTYIGGCLIFAAIIALLFANSLIPFPYSLSAIVIGSALIKFDKGNLPPTTHTLGDMAKDYVQKHYGNMIADGAQFRPQEARRILINCLSSWSDYTPPNIQRDTKLLTN